MRTTTTSQKDSTNYRHRESVHGQSGVFREEYTERNFLYDEV